MNLKDERCDSSKPIRILQVVTYMGRGGLETMLMNYYRHIDRSKVQFDFLVHRDMKADYDDEIESLGGKIYRLPRLVPWSATYNKALGDFFSAHPEYRIVHVHQDCLSSIILKAAENHGVPVRIAHSHCSSQDKNIKYPIKLFYQRQIPQYATALLACGQDAGEWMFRGADFRILNNAIDAAAYCYDLQIREAKRSEFGIAGGSFVVGHIGRFSPQKNHIGLLKIFAAIHNREPNSVLMLVGDGNLRGAIEKQIVELRLADAVVMTGVRSDVPDLLQAMDVFAFPSNYEGLPVTMVEAQASGLPCFISDKVPIECKITDLVTQIPLAATPEVWAENILAARGQPHRDTYAEIAQSGFDIRENAAWLQNFYLEQWKANE